MGQAQSSDAIPYDANSWRRLSREYLNALNSQQDLSELNYGPSRNISRSRQSLDWNVLNEAKHSQHYHSEVNYLPRAVSYSALDRHTVRDNATGSVNLHLTEEKYRQQYRDTADITNHTDNNVKIEQTRPSSPFTHLARFRSGKKATKADKNGNGNDPSVVRMKEPSRTDVSYVVHHADGGVSFVGRDHDDDGHHDDDDDDDDATVALKDEEYKRSKYIPKTSGTVNGLSGTTMPGTKSYRADEQFESRNNYQNGRNIHEQYTSNEPNYERVHHIPYRDIHTSNQRLNQSRTSLNSGWSVNSQPGQYNFQSGEPYFRRSSRIQREKSIGPLKWLFIFLIFLNIASSIWNVIYMWRAGKRIEYGFPLQGKLYVKSNSQIGLYQILLVALLLVSNAVNIVAIWATLANRYWVLWVYVILAFIFGLFGAGSELLRGSYTAWLLPILCGLFAISVTHHVALLTY